MKRTNNIVDYFKNGVNLCKKFKVEESKEKSHSNLSIWTDSQREYFMKKYSWLEISENNSVGCNVCAQFTNLGLGPYSSKYSHLSTQWQAAEVAPNGTNKESQQASIRKKMREHQSSFAHGRAMKIIEECKLTCKETPTAPTSLPAEIVSADDEDGDNNDDVDVDDDEEEMENCDKYDDHDFDMQSTVNLFNTVYSLIKQNRPMSDITDELILQKKNGVTFGSYLISNQTGMLIGRHISRELRKSIFSNIISQQAKLCIIIDEVIDSSQNSMLVMFLSCNINDFDDPVNIFVDLTELNLTDAETICETLLSILTEHGFTNNYLKDNLIAFWSDGENSMLGRQSEVAARLISLFPSIYYHDFRDFLEGQELPLVDIPQIIKEVRDMLREDTTAGSVDDDRTCDLVNNVSKYKIVDNISHLITVKLIGKPLEVWDATPFVESWFQRGHHTVTDVNVKKKNVLEHSQNELTLWSLF
ncbi:hypothetical protein CHUAL_014186 [Chamberlinius hualienensis]